MAEVAETHPAVGEVLHQLLGFNDDVYIAMTCLDDCVWRRLGDRNQHFQPF